MTFHNTVRTAPLRRYYSPPSISRLTVIGLSIAATIAMLLPAQINAQTASTAVDLQVLSTSIASDSVGDTYYADTAHNTIYEVSNTGLTKRIGCCANLFSLSQPRGLALDSKNNLYVADTGNNRVLEIGKENQAFVVNTQLYYLSRPSGVAIDSAGDIYIADSGNNRILEVAAGGQAAIVDTGSYRLAGPTAVAVDPDGTLYISDNGNNRIVSVPTSGSPTVLFAKQLNAPLGITLGTGGGAYIAQTGSGVRSTPASGAGGASLPAVVASFSATNINVNEGNGARNSVASVKITLTPLDGFTNTLYLSVLGLPPDMEMQLSHPIVTLNGNGSVTETLQIGEASATQQSLLINHLKHSFDLGLANKTLAVAGIAPVSLLFLIGLRFTGKQKHRVNKILGAVVLLVLLPATLVVASGCADGYPAGLFGSSTYTATLAARTANGTSTYPLGSFGITVQ